MTNDLSFSSLAQTSEALRRREISPLELVRAHIDRAKAINDDLNCLITMVESQAVAAARRAEAEILKGRHLGMLHGIPFTAKDIFATAGIRTTAGSRILADWIPQENAALVERLTEAGAILIAKTSMSEFAAGPTNSNEHYGPARNPWNPDSITGGSSGGSAAAVAAGVGVFSLGTDTGGSVRIPASLCGVLGLKPTFGRASRHGVIPLSPSLDTVGILARSAEDATLLFETLCGPGTGNGGAGPDSGASHPEPRLQGIRIGLPTELLLERCDAEIRQGFLLAVRLLGELGADIVEISLPYSAHAPAVVNLITWAESAALHRHWFARSAASYGRHMRDQILGGSAIGARDYIEAVQTRRMISARSEESLREVDIIALPTVSIAAPAIAPRHDPAILAALRQYTRFASCTGQPALSIPCGFNRDRMPIGLQLVGKHRREHQLLRVAKAYEQARGSFAPCPRIRRDREFGSDGGYAGAFNQELLR